MRSAPSPLPDKLRRSLGLLDIFFLGVNGVVGAGIFLLPNVIAAAAGPWYWAVYLAGGFVCFLVALCFAEMGSRYGATGGSYLYARDNLGPFWGFLVGWIMWLSGILGWASVVTGFVSQLAASPFGRGLGDGFPARAAIVAAVAMGLGWLNLRGARLGAGTNNLFSICKLVPLAIFVAVGASRMVASPLAVGGHAGAAAGQLTSAMLAAIFLYSGFEWIPVPAGEVRDPQRDVPRAIFLVLATAAVVYIAVHTVAQGTLPGLAAVQNGPLDAAAAAFLGGSGVLLMSVGSLVSILGVNASIAFTTPRSMYALADDGYLPRVFRDVHPRWGTPWACIVVTSAIVLALPVMDAGSAALRASLSPALAAMVPRFSLDALVRMSALVSLMEYIPTCLSVLIARRRRPEAGGFRAPLGSLVPVAALFCCLALFYLADPADRNGTLLGMALGLPIYLLVRSVRSGTAAPPLS